MPNVEVEGARSTDVTLAYDSDANALAAQNVANLIQAGITSGTIIPANSGFSGSPPPLFGRIGEWVQNTTGVPTIPKGYDYIVDAAAVATMIDQNTDTDQSVLVGSGNLIFNASGAGTIFGGDGNDQITVPVSDTGSWTITLGDGGDTIKALGSGNDAINVGSGNDAITTGSGNDTITTGSGSDAIQLGAGNSSVTAGGAATITASSGSETVSGNGMTVVNGNASRLLFVSEGGGATIFGGTGSDTATGGAGPDVFHGGTGGDNLLIAGTGAATLFGGGNADRLTANGSGEQILFAGSGNETLTGSSAGGASDTFVGSGGNTTALVTPADLNLFEFIHGSAGGTEFVTGLTSIEQVQVHLSGYASNSLASVASQNNAGGNLNVTLTDGTQIAFQNITQPLTNGNFH